MKTYSAEEGLTEEAVVTKLRICRYHHLYLHSSLRNNSSGLDLIPEQIASAINLARLTHTTSQEPGNQKVITYTVSIIICLF
jgi:hypothetical protein